MKGYIFPIQPREPKSVKEFTLVGCKRCREIWREWYEFSNDVRVNGPMYIYDICDKCITDDDRKIGFR